MRDGLDGLESNSLDNLDCLRTHFSVSLIERTVSSHARCAVFLWNGSASLVQLWLIVALCAA